MPKTPAEKLLIKPGSSVYKAGDTPETRDLLEPMPEDAVYVEHANNADVAVLFAMSRANLDDLLEANLEDLRGTRAAWIGYLQGGRSNINRDTIWTRVNELNWTLNANVAISEKWSAVRLKALD